MKGSLLILGMKSTSALFTEVLRQWGGDRPTDLPVTYLLDNKDDWRTAKGKLSSLKGVHIRFLYDGFQPSDPFHLDEEKVREWEERYGVPNLVPYILCETKASAYPETERWNYLLSHIQFLEQFLRQNTPEILICGPVESTASWLTLTLCKKLGVHCYSLSPSPLPGKIFFADNPHEILGVRTLYEKFLRHGIPPDKLARAHDWYARLRSRQEQTQTPMGPLSKQRGRRLPFNPLKRFWLKKHVVSKLNFEEKYFYMPLHLEPDASWRIRGMRYLDQLDLVEIAADSLPIDHSLYVQEHPKTSPGHRPLAFYRRLSRFPRVCMVSQEIPAASLIERSSGVLTLAGTVGWEALWREKAVFLFGHRFYEELKERVIRIDDLEGLPRLLIDAEDRPLDENQFLCFMAAVLEKTWDGFLDDSSPSFDQLLSQENVRQFARFFQEACDGRLR